jgi:hypothetical protein
VNLRSQDNYKSSFWDWTFLNDSFGETKIRVTDIDGMVERNGQFLFIETKKPNEKIPKGQEILHKRLVDTGIFTVMVIWGYPQQPTKFSARRKGGNFERDNANLETIKQFVSEWFKWADKQSPSPRHPLYIDPAPTRRLAVG